MKRFEVYEIKRTALGLSKAQLAEIAGVSAATVANYEAGKDVSYPYVKSITMAIDREFKALDREQYQMKRLLQQVLQLNKEDNKESKLKTLGYIMMTASKLNVDLTEMDDFKD